MWKPLLACLLSLTGPVAAQAPDLAALLAAAVDQPTALARAAAAEILAARKDVSLDAWLEAMQGFEANPALRPVREGSKQVELIVAGSSERTELCWYVPDDLALGSPVPLLVGMHPTGGNGPGAIREWRRVADDWGAILLAPSEAGPNVGFAATARERESVLAAIRWARRHWNIDENRIALAGFSRGAHMAWDLALRHPSQFCAIVPVSGAPRFELARGAANLRYLENLRSTAVYSLIGRHDQEGLVWTALECFRRLDELEAPLAKLVVDEQAGHMPDRSGAEFGVFLAGAQRNPDPESLVRLYAHAGEGRAAWLEVLEGTKPTEEVFRPTIRATKHKQLDDDGLRRFLVDATAKHTGRIQLKRDNPGRYSGKHVGIKRFRILIEQEHLPEDGRIVAKLANKRLRATVKADPAVLLKEFVEHFDRTFLPVAEAHFQTKR
ncbi:MAG: putative esterase [Planctomycetota bacterium]|jgi:predicted esterase